MPSLRIDFSATFIIIIEPYWIADQNVCDSAVTSRIIFTFYDAQNEFC